MKKCAFTICTYSYTGLAETLKQSFITNNPEYDFFIVYIDRIHEGIGNILVDNILKKYMHIEDIIDMRFKYDVTEYSTSVKPFVFRYLFSENYSKVLYFDPDIKVYSKLEEINDDKFDAYVTPHRLSEPKSTDLDIEEVNMLKYGLFNCGFIGFNNTDLADSFLNFWSNCLINYAFNDPNNSGVYTDQKWADFIFLNMRERVKIIDSPGYNFAPWNMDERKVMHVDHDRLVTFSYAPTEKYKLIFAHFSGFNYKQLMKTEIIHKSGNIIMYDDLKNVFIDYGKSLVENRSDEYINEYYAYNNYNNGRMISKLNRRLYRTLGIKYSNPFDSEGEFYQLMLINGLIAKNKFDATAHNTKNLGNKKKAILLMLKIFKRILGIDKYTELLRALQMYSIYENQTFLVKK